MPNTTKDDAKGYQVKKERLTGLFHGVLSLIVEEVKETPSPLLPSCVVINPWQQAVVNQFVATCESEATPPKQKPKALQPFLD